MVLRIFQDKSLSGFLTGIVIVKLLRKQIPIPRHIKRKIDTIKLGFLILKNFKKDWSDVDLGKGFSDVNFMWKDTGDKNSHLHFFPKEDEIGIGMVVTDETKTSSERHFPVDNKRFFEVFGKEIDDYFKNEQEILDVNTSRFDNSRIVSYNPSVVFPNDVKGKTLYLELEENEKELSIEEFKKAKKVMCINITEDGEPKYFLIKNDEKIHCFGYSAMKQIAIELFPILGGNYRNYDGAI